VGIARLAISLPITGDLFVSWNDSEVTPVSNVIVNVLRQSMLDGRELRRIIKFDKNEGDSLHFLFSARSDRID
jgi:hypothetical protein